MRIDIATLFPDMCRSVTGESILGRAQEKGAVEIFCHNIREYTLNKHKRVDDTPYGGGMGMVMQAEPVWRCWEAICGMNDGVRPYTIYLSPKGKVFQQADAIRLANMPRLCLLCGHYEGVDQRVLDKIVDEEISIGDYVLTGGELPALVVTDAIIRLLPGVLPAAACYEEESHYNGLLEYPQYTRPEVWMDCPVPEVLLSGHHKNIAAWRREMSLEITKEQRPELLKNALLTEEERQKWVCLPDDL